MLQPPPIGGKGRVQPNKLKIAAQKLSRGEDLVPKSSFLNTGCLGENLFDSPEAMNQSRGGFRSYTGHAGNVVDRISHQGQIVRNALRFHPELLPHAGDIQERHTPLLSRDGQGDTGLNQLPEILVRRNNGYGMISPRRHHCGDEVVRLAPLVG